MVDKGLARRVDAFVDYSQRAGFFGLESTLLHFFLASKSSYKQFSKIVVLSRIT